MIENCFSFLVYPKKGERFFFTVRIFHSKREMRAYHDALPASGKQADGFEAVTMPVVYENPNGKAAHPNLGEILFYRPMTGASIVSHEMTHAALHYARVVKLDLNLAEYGSASEEPLAHTIGYMTRQFFMKY